MFRKLGLYLAAAALGGQARAADVFADATECFVNPDPAIGINDYGGTSYGVVRRLAGARHLARHPLT